MGILLRSAIVIGVIAYLSPLGYNSRTTQPSAGHGPQSGNSLSSRTADDIWQILPDAAKKAVMDEAQKRTIEAARKKLTETKGKAESSRTLSPFLDTGGKSSSDRSQQRD